MDLTQYLIEKIGVKPDQIDDIYYQAQHRQCSPIDQLCLSGLLDEPALLAMLAELFGWPTVGLTDLKLDRTLLQLISGRLAWKLKVLPLALDSDSRTLSLACRTPDDAHLKAELETNFPNLTIRLVAAAGPLLETAIISNYRNESLITRPDNTSGATSTVAIDIIQKKERAFIIGGLKAADKLLGHTLVEEGYEVFIADSLTELTDELAELPPTLVLIRDEGSRGSSDQAIDLSLLPKTTTVRRYNSVSELFDPSPDLIEHGRMAVANLHLATKALAASIKSQPEDILLIGSLVERLCRQLNLSPHDHLITVTAGYLQDLAALHFKGAGPRDRQTAFFVLQGLIDEADVYPLDILAVIREMYVDLTKLKTTEATTSRLRNGNILTIVDSYLRQYPDQDKLTTARFDLVKQHFSSQTGHLLLPEVIEAMLTMLKVDVVKHGEGFAVSRALIFDQAGLTASGLDQAISECNFSVSVVESHEQFIARYLKRKPDLIIITASGEATQIESTLMKLVGAGLVFSTTPSFLLHQSTEHKKLMPLLKLGLNDIIPHTENFDIIRLRLNTIADERELESRNRLQVLQEMGTHGSLTHMNVIDILQSMGPSNKTLCINVSALSHQLTMYLHQGQLTYAQCDSIEGVKAVFEALKWSSGIWSVDHIKSEELPEANIDRTIDSILMEGCYLLDEMNPKQTADEPEIDLGKALDAAMPE